MLRRPGVSLVEILIGLAILSAIAAALYPAMSAQLRRGRSAALANQISNLRSAIVSYQENVTRYPRTVSQLANTLASTATDACDQTMTPNIRNNWRGPYLTQAVSGDMSLGGLTVKDTLLRNPTTDAGSAPGTLIIRFVDVDTLMAYDIERQFDPTVDYTTGSIVWSSVGSDTLRFQMLIRNC